MKRAVLFLLVVVVAGLWSAAAAAGSARVEGRVSDSGNGAPIAGAVIGIPSLGLSTISGADGTFELGGVALEGEFLETTVTASAAGYGEWTLQDIRLIPGDTLILEIKLGPAPTLIVVPPPRAEIPAFPALQLAQGFQGGAGLSQLELPLPATIRVRVTGYPYCDTSRPYTVETVDFKQYAKHVLPNEWVANWPWESIRAGGMAVKMYAWSYIAVGGKWPDADVYDSTCDQVYNPAYSYASTNQAIEDTWNWRLTRGDRLLRTFYRAFYSQCQAVRLEGNCMGQVESREMAFDAFTWDEILFAFYDDAALSPVWNPPGGFSLRFHGNGYGDLDRVKIRIDPPVPADIGGVDFTLEWWMKAVPGENDSAGCATGGDNWFYGNTVFDRDVFG
ncbi:MAG: carboxypeptidase regulatory-like domain-containing protein, partial [Anaerolineales bacterium]